MPLKLLIDMDGIIVDFMSKVTEYYGYPTFQGPKGVWNWIPVLCQQLDMEEKDFWNNLPHQIWRDMDWMPDGRTILHKCIDTVGEQNCCIVTSPANPESAKGKMMWFAKHLPTFLKDGRYALCKNKAFFANEKTMLVDDADHNVNAFKSAGGNVFLYPRYWNTKHESTLIGYDTFATLMDNVKHIVHYEKIKSLS